MSNTESNTSRSGWPLRLLAASAAAVVAWYGIAPLLYTAASDLVSISNMRIVFFALIAGLAAIVSDLALIRTSTFVGSSGPSILRHWVVRTFISSLVVTVLAAAFLSWESNNLFSWRMADRIEPAAQVTKYRSGLRGTQLASLNISQVEKAGGSLATVALPWHLSTAGGLIQLAMKTSGTGSVDVNGNCSGEGQPGFASATGGSSNPTAIVTLEYPCATWSLAHLEIRAGTGYIDFRLSESFRSTDSIELAFVGSKINYGIAWTILSISAFAGVFAGLACLVRQPHDTSRDKASVGRIETHRNRLYAIWAIFAAILFLVVANFGVYSFVAKERTIYAWDFGGHWMSAVTVSKAIRPGAGGVSQGDPAGLTMTTDAISGTGSPSFVSGDPGPLAALVRNIRYSEYNVTSAIALAIPMSLAGPTRLAYELSLVNIYAFAAVATLALLLWCLVRGQPNPVPGYWPIVPAVLVLGFNPFWVPFMRGYIGICIVAVNILVFWLYFRRPIDEQKVHNLLLIAVLLACSVILRRWNAYWIVGFFVIALLDAARVFLSTKAFTLEAAISAFRTVFVVGLGALVTLSVLAWPLVITMVTTDYSDIYSAYADQSGSVAVQVDHFVRTFGFGLILFTIMAAVYLFFESRTRWVALLLSLHTAVVVLHFSSTQQMGPHHMYVLMPAVFALLGLALLHGISRVDFRTRVVAQVLLAVYVFSGLASNYAVFGVNGDPVRQAFVPWVPDNRRTPLVRHDIGEFERLVSYLDSIMDELPPSSGIYALSSSTVFSSAQLKMLEVSTGIPFRSRDRVLRTAAVDKRDGFPRGLLRAEIVVVGVPVQYNVPPEDQHVIGIPANLMVSQTGVGSAFRKLAQEFNLDDGVLLYVYERARVNRPDEVEDLSRRLRDVYPDRPEIYSP